MSKNKVINVNIIIDTCRVMDDYKNPSKDQNNPTGIGNSYQFMVASDNTGLSGQGTGNLRIKAKQGDVVRFYATSEYNNFDNPVIVYQLFNLKDNDLFQNPNFQLEDFPDADIIVPEVFNPLNAVQSTQNFWFAQNTVNAKGEQNYGLQFALYDSSLSLFGYFSWKPTVMAF
ncbi:hypothetical protein L1276_004485 [Flavobacterium sp. HSC-32F16]|uniref:inclusion body family protein n=1 Tax=Flavobacterium sp. HSC-32F16 TaxID=2910964 RepID=UPI0020A51608|nr:inclusion body family protein [Flavobacterium sp. HSC-32F16]MCP2029301.1 hypothetical protein [Flavobacterium sp. HSC-32F16]